MLARLILVVACLAGSAAFAPPAAAQEAPAAADVDAALRRVLEGSRYQRELPGRQDATDGVPGRGSGPRGRPGGRPPEGGSGRRGSSGGLPAGGGGAGILWIFAIVLLGGLLVALVVAIIQGGSASGAVATTTGTDQAAAPPPAPAGGPADPGPAPLDDAEALARAGRFADAMHVLLLRTLAALVAQRGAELPVAYTSRDVLRRVRMPNEPRAALARLVGAVELVLFGGRTAGEDDYRACVEHFEQFRSAARG